MDKSQTNQYYCRQSENSPLDENEEKIRHSQFFIDEDNFVTAHMIHYKKSIYNSIIYLAAELILYIFIIRYCYTLPMSGVGYYPENNIDRLVNFAIIFLPILIVIQLYNCLPARFKKLAKKTYHDLFQMKQQMTLNLNEDHLSIYTDYSNDIVPWQFIHQYTHKDDYVLIYTSALSFFIIPLKKLPPNFDLEFLLAKLNEHSKPIKQ